MGTTEEDEQPAWFVIGVEAAISLANSGAPQPRKLLRAARARALWSCIHNGNGVGLVRRNNGRRWVALSSHAWVTGGTPTKVFKAKKEAEAWCWAQYRQWLVQDALSRLGIYRIPAPASTT